MWAEQPGEQGLPRQEEEQAAGDGGGAGGGAAEELEAQAAAREHGGEVRQAEKADEPLLNSLKVPQNWIHIATNHIDPVKCDLLNPFRFYTL